MKFSCERKDKVPPRVFYGPGKPTTGIWADTMMLAFLDAETQGRRSIHDFSDRIVGGSSVSHGDIFFELAVRIYGGGLMKQDCLQRQRTNATQFANKPSIESVLVEPITAFCASGELSGSER